MLITFSGLTASANPIEQDTTVAQGDTLLIDNEDLVLDDATLTVFGEIETRQVSGFTGNGTVLLTRETEDSLYTGLLAANSDLYPAESLTIGSGITLRVQNGAEASFGGGNVADRNFGLIETVDDTFSFPPTYFAGEMVLGNPNGFINHGTIAAREDTWLYVRNAVNFDNQGTVVIEDNAAISFYNINDLNKLGNLQIAPTGELRLGGRLGQPNTTMTLNSATGDAVLTEYVIMDRVTYNNTNGERFSIRKSGPFGLGIYMTEVTLNTDLFIKERYAEIDFRDGLTLNATVLTESGGLFQFDGTQTIDGSGAFRNVGTDYNFHWDSYYRMKGVLTLASGITVESVDAENATDMRFERLEENQAGSVVVQGQVLGSSTRRDITFDDDVPVTNQGSISGRVLFLGDMTNEAGATTSAEGNRRLQFRGVTTNRGQMSASGGGALEFTNAQTFTNEAGAQVTVNNGGFLVLSGNVVNNGTIDVEGGGYAQRAGTTIAGSGSLDVRNSTVYLYESGFLSSLAMPPSTTNDNDRMLAGATIDLAGGELGFADLQGQRFGVHGGRLANGTVRSLDGSPLVFDFRPAVFSQFNSTSVPGFANTLTLTGITLEADLTIGSSQRLDVDGIIGGSGVVTLDGGQLNINPGGTTAISDPVLAGYDLRSGDVFINAGIDNTGKTIAFTAGVDWTISPSISQIITGGVLEAKAGVNVAIRPIPTVVPTRTHFDGVTLAGEGSFEVLWETHARNGLGLDNGTVYIGTEQATPNNPGVRLVLLGDTAITGTGDILFRPETIGRSGPITHQLITTTDPTAADPHAVGLTIGQGVRVLASLGDGYIGGMPAGSQFSPVQGTAAPITNQGQIILENGKDLQLFTSTFNQTGFLTVNAGSTLNLFTDNAVFDGQTDLGGDLVVTGPVALHANSQFMIELGEDTLTEASVRIDGTLDLLGSILPVFLDGYNAQAGETHLLFTATGGVQGKFDTISFHFGDGLRGNLVYYSDRVELVTYFIPGDANGDGKVTAADLVILDANFGQAGTFSDGDFNGDGFVTAADLVILDANFGVGAGVPITESRLTPIPEPSSLALLGLAGLLLNRRRRLAV